MRWWLFWWGQWRTEPYASPVVAPSLQPACRPRMRSAPPCYPSIIGTAFGSASIRVPICLRSIGTQGLRKMRAIKRARRERTRDATPNALANIADDSGNAASSTLTKSPRAGAILSGVRMGMCLFYSFISVSNAFLASRSSKFSIGSQP